jgi:hypothetical protein
MRDSRGEKTPSGVTVIIVALFRSRNEGVNGCGVASAVHPPTDWIRSTDTLSVLMSLSKAKPKTPVMKKLVFLLKLVIPAIILNPFFLAGLPYLDKGFMMFGAITSIMGVTVLTLGLSNKAIEKL